MSKEEIKKRAEKVAEALGYNINHASLELINVCDSYCMGYAFGVKEKEDFAKQEAIGFFKWYGVKMVGFIEYIKDIRPTVTSDEIEEKMKEFEGQSFENLHALYLNSKEQP